MKQNYCSPVVGQYTITSVFGYRIHPIKNVKQYHTGVDISNGSGNNNPGSPIYAIDDGTVQDIVRARQDNNGKWTLESITIQHDDPDIGFSRYLHLYQGSTNHLGVGDRVTIGEEIGKMGNTGGSTGAHLHFEILSPDETYLDPVEIYSKTSKEIIAGQYVRRPDNTITIPKGAKREVRDGTFYSIEDDQAVIAPPGPLPMRSSPINNAVGEPIKGKIRDADRKESENKEEVEKASEEELRASLIGYYMPEIIKAKQKKPYPKNLIFLNAGENTGALSNMVLSKTQKDFGKITNLELANMVPFIELYSLKRNGDKVEEFLYPFDDYTQKTKIESIFYDKTGRGGNIGIKSLDWEILATNPSNRSQISAKLKIYIQDIQEIETIRNGISLIDFLYPTGTRDDTYEAHNFQVKMKVGWLYKREQNSTLTELEQKIAEKDLQEVMHLCLAKHVFEFMEDGSVELTLDYFGMIESDITNPNRVNILDKLNPVRKPKERVVKWLQQILKIFEDEDSVAYLQRNMEKINNDPLFKRFGIKIEKTLRVEAQQSARPAAAGAGLDTRIEKTEYYINFDNLQSEVSYQQEFGTVWQAIKEAFFKEETGTKKISLNKGNQEKLVEIAKKEVANAQKELALSYKTGLTNFFDDVAKNKLLSYLKVPVNIVDQLREYSVADSVFSTEELQNFATLKNRDSISLELSSNINEAIKVTEQSGFGESKYIFDEKEFTKEITKQYETETGSGSHGDMLVPYVHFDSVLSYYVRLFYEQADIKEINELRIVLGSFSYRDLGDFASDRKLDGSAAPNNNNVVLRNGEFVERLTFAKKYANLGDLPISIESLIRWYNSNVLDADLSKMSFHKFLKSLINDILPANITNNILPFVPSRSIPISINYITTPSVEPLEKELEELGKNVKKGYIIDMTGKKYKKTNFHHFRANQILKPKKDDKTNYNYMFLFSSLETDDSLSGEYEQDLDKNIYHFYVGEETGLVKRLKFTREDNKQLDAANIIKANNGDSDTAVMRQIYNLDLEMFGNTIFQPGQLLHVVPTYPGARLKNKILFDIGLGGYYQITKMSSYIDDNDFKTSIKAHWQASGFGNERDRDQANIYRSETGDEFSDEQ